MLDLKAKVYELFPVSIVARINKHPEAHRLAKL
mgnify:FL=1|jgi:hypothetical protein